MNETTTQDAGDVVPLPATRPPVDTLPTPSQRYLPGYSPYMPNYDYDWHRILTPPPSNDARSGLPDSLQPGYRPQMPYQLAGAPVASPDQPATPEQRNYTVTGTGPGTWWSRQQQPPGQWQDRPDGAGPQSQPQPASVALNRPPAFQQGHQPGPWPAAYPNSPRFDPAQAPPLPGETPQETADLNKFMGHETGNRGNIINDWAARDPSRYYQGQTCQGYWQITNSTWRDGAQRAGVDLRQYPTAMTAPYPVQRAVALALYRSYGGRPWAVPPGAGERGDRFALRPQQPPPAEPRDYRDWGRDDATLTSAPPRDFGPGPSGQGGLGQPPQESGWVRVLNGVGPLLVGIASLALRLPLSTAITAAGAMARAQDNGQREAYERARTRMQDQLKEANAQQTLESREASDAFVEYGNNNPAGLQQTLAQIALKYNDPIMYRMAEQGDLNGIHQLQQRRDLYNQDLTRANKAAQDEQDRRDVNADVAARDRQWDQEHPNATPEERAIAHVQHLGQAQQDFSGKSAGAGEEAKVYNVVDKDSGKPTGKQVRVGKDGGLFDLNGQPTTLAPNEKLGDEAGVRATQDKPEQEGEVRNVLGPDGKRTGQQVREGKTGGYFDPDSGERTHLKPGETIEQPGAASRENLSEAKPYDVLKDGKVVRTVLARERKDQAGFIDAQTGEPIQLGPGEALQPHVAPSRTAEDLSEPKPYDVVKDGKVVRTVMARTHKDQPGFFDARTGNEIQLGEGEELQPHTAQRPGAGVRFGTVDDLMQKWHEQFVKDNNREPTTEEIANQRKEFTQESKPPPMSSRQVSQRLGIAIGEAAGGVAALTQLSAGATLGPWGGAQAALTTGVYDNFLRSLTNRMTPQQSQMMNSIAKVIARPLASLEAAGVATGLVGVTQSLQQEFPQAGDTGYTVLTKLANIRNIVDAAADMLDRDKNLDPDIKKLIADNRAKVDAAIPYTLGEVVSAQANPTRENMQGLAERLLHQAPQGQGGQGRSSLPPGVTVEVK